MRFFCVLLAKLVTMKKIYFLFSLIIGLLLHAQNNSLGTKKFLQVNTYNGGQILNTIFDFDGNHISVGYANGSYTFLNDAIPTIGLDDLYIAKTNKFTKEKIWLKTFNAGTKGKIHPVTINVDSENNIYVACILQGQILINGDTFSTTSPGTSIKLLLKLSSSGDVIWGKNIEHSISNSASINIENQNLVLFNGSTTFSILNKDSGELMLTKSLSNLNISTVKLKNNQIYLGARTMADIQILGKTILRQNAIIIRTDLNFTEDAFIRFYPQNSPDTTSSAIRINDIMIDEDNAVYYAATYPSTTIISSENHSGTIVNGATTSSSGSKNLWLGKYNPELTVSAWFYGSAFNNLSTNSFFDGVKLYKGEEGSLHFIMNSPKSSITYKGEYISFQERGMISIKNDGTLISSSDFVSPFDLGSNRADISIYIDNGDTFTSFSQNPNSYISKKAFNEKDFSNYHTYSSSGNYGYLSSRELFKVYENGEIFNSYITNGKILNYFGQENESAVNNNIISKISTTGNLEWMIKADGIIDNYSGYWIEGHRLDINTEKEVVSVFNCYKDDFSNCKITDSQGHSQEFEYARASISKFDQTGAFKWSKDLAYGIYWPGPPSTRDISAYYDNEGNIIIVGKTSSSQLLYGGEYLQVNGNGFFILKLDANGNKLFFKSFPYQTNSELFTRFDQQNNIFMFFNVENQNSDMYFDNVTVPQNGQNSNKFVLLKMNPQGTVLGAKNYLSSGVPNTDYQSTAVKFEGDDFVLYGHTYSNMNLQNETFTNPYPNSSSYSTALISKVNINGDVLWSHPFFSSDYSNSPFSETKNLNSNNIDFDSDKNIYLVDIWNQSINYRGQEIPLTGYKSMFFKLDAFGNLKYHKEIDDPSSNTYLSIYGKDKVAIIGNSTSNFVLDNLVNDQGGFNNYILFLEKEELATQEFKKNIFNLYPNPTSDFIHIDTKEKIKSIEVYDATGRKVDSKINHENQVDVTKLLKGLYYIRINTNAKSLTSKFIKN